jgi:hypothetical protein
MRREPLAALDHRFRDVGVNRFVEAEWNTSEVAKENDDGEDDENGGRQSLRGRGQDHRRSIINKIRVFTSFVVSLEVL